MFIGANFLQKHRMGRGAQTEKGGNPENKKIGRRRLARGKRAQPVKKAKLRERCPVGQATKNAP